MKRLKHRSTRMKLNKERLSIIFRINEFPAVIWWLGNSSPIGTSKTCCC